MGSTNAYKHVRLKGINRRLGQYLVYGKGLSLAFLLRMIYMFFLSFFINVFIYYLFLTVLGLHCCTWAISSCGDQGLLFVAVCGLLIVVASLVVEHRL